MSESRGRMALDPAGLEEDRGSDYPLAYRDAVAGRTRRALGDAFGLTQFGVNLTTLAPGTMSAHRHWHSHEDELVYLLEGELVLVTDAGETELKPGMCAGFKAGTPDGHHLINRSDRVALLLEIGSRRPEDEVVYSDIDMEFRRTPEGHRFLRKSGEPY